MGNAATNAFRPRKNFGKIEKILDIPNLIDMQKESYNRFLQQDVPPEERQDVGLQNVFRSVFPITDFSGTSSLEFVSYSFGEVKYDQEECLARGMTYEAPIKITVRLVVYDVNKETGAQSIRDIKEQEIYFGTLPLMTEKGTFIVNGTERVVVSQLHRSPGIFFDLDKSRTSASGRLAYTARIIPLRGSWIDFEFDPKEHLHVRIDRRRKFPVTILLKAIGYTEVQLLEEFYRVERFYLKGRTQVAREVNADFLRGKEASVRIAGAGGETIVKAGRKITKKALRAMQEQAITQIGAKDEDLLGCISAREIADKDGTVLLGANEDITPEILEKLREAKVREVDVLHIEGPHITPSLALTLRLDKIQNQEDAVLDIYRKLRPSNPPTMDVARSFFNNLFFNPEHYDLSKVGRLKLNLRLGMDLDLDHRTLTPEDILAAVKQLIALKDSEGPVDDIDHLGNRRVRAVGELLENQYRIGLVRVERAIKERMSLQETEALMPHDLVNSKPVSAVVKEFFGTSQLSQFMDQTNPLSEVTHKRRLSALGPGGLTRERAGFEVRDVHPTHYGRICPIETPEGPNIGLIVSLSTYARVNEFGFIETPYRTARDGQVQRDIHYLTALDEKDFAIAQANAPLDDKGHFVREVVNARREGEFVQVTPGEVTYMDVSPNQLVSVAASLIPFLENDDANRALMGSNMQRQAVPLLSSQAPLVGTGMEAVVAEDSGVTVRSKGDGQVVSVDADRIVIRYDPADDISVGGVEIHKLTKYQRSNQNTCFNQKPIVDRGQRVHRGQVIADGPATSQGELALGRNVMVAFMSWGGYNFEDSILVSERVVKEDIYTSVHIEEFETVARDTKLGKEEITRDIPNLGEESLVDLDEAGIVRIGAYVGPGHILVGKITPKGETQLSPEEKLLRAIFGEKAGDVKDTSLRVPPGVEGIVIDARVFSRRGVDKDERAKAIEDDEIGRLLKDQNDEIAIIRQNAFDRLVDLLEGRSLAAPFRDDSGRAAINKNTKLTLDVLKKIPIRRMNELVVAKADDELMTAVEQVVDAYVSHVDLIKESFEAKIGRLKRGDELPPGVIKMVKVYVAMKRKLSVGDKMAGRHGNKGVVSRVLPVEDMPYFEDGTPVDVVLNPLGVPSRMNVGQVLETHLGWAAYGLGHKIGQILEKAAEAAKVRQTLSRIYGKQDYAAHFKDLSDEAVLDTARSLADEGVPMATPVFDGASEEEIRDLLTEAGLPEVGQARLFDGRTGIPFDQPVTVGMMYILKLHHLVDDKLHARSIGPYSLVTQQPLGGKAQFGGQRLGEMEVWAMEAYGAAYSLQEFLTVKSDDVVGRTRMYEKIVKGDNTLEADLPESFNVLIKELQSLGLDVELLEETAEEA